MKYPGLTAFITTVALFLGQTTGLKDVRPVGTPRRSRGPLLSREVRTAGLGGTFRLSTLKFMCKPPHVSLKPSHSCVLGYLFFRLTPCMRVEFTRNKKKVSPKYRSVLVVFFKCPHTTASFASRPHDKYSTSCRTFFELLEKGNGTLRQA